MEKDDCYFSGFFVDSTLLPIHAKGTEKIQRLLKEGYKIDKISIKEKSKTTK